MDNIDNNKYYTLFSDWEISSQVSFVVEPIDGFTGQIPTGPVQVSIKNSHLKPIRNLSRLYVFRVTPPEAFQLIVQSPHFFTETLSFTPKDIQGLDSRNPVIMVNLIPRPSYPFPAGVTLIRGMVRDNGGLPVRGAAVRLAGKETAARTTEKGEFVFFIKGLTQNDTRVHPETGKRLVFLDNSEVLHLEIVHGKAMAAVEAVNLEEGQSTALKQPIILKL